MTSTALPAPGARHGSRLLRALRAFATGISAVGTKELRGRMRGRRAFVIVTVYLLVLSAFAFGVYLYLRQQAALQAESLGGVDRPIVAGLFSGSGGIALSADIGHAIYSGLLLVLTLLVMVLAPALTTGAISMEREKGTIDLLVTTPLSTLGMVIGKLASALSYVLLLIVASIPLMAIVFVFGGVGPEDLVRAYGLLFALAFGMGAVGLFISAITRRTQTATVLTLIVVLVLTLGSVAVFELWKVLATDTSRAANGTIAVGRADRAPQALLWLNPFVGDLDLVCTTAPGGYEPYVCDYVASVTGTPFFATASTGGGAWSCPPNADCAMPAMLEGIRRDVLVQAFARGFVGDGPAVAPAEDVAPQPLTQFGFPRDTFWPRNALAFVVLGVVLTLLSAQLVAPTRRLRIRRGRGPDGPAEALRWAPLAAAPDPFPATAPVPAAGPVPAGTTAPQEEVLP